MSQETGNEYHKPVLLTESIDGLDIKPGGIYVDATFGGGGHSREILRRMDSTAHLYSFDQDADAERNIVDDDRFTFVRSNFRYLKNWMQYYGIQHIDGTFYPTTLTSRSSWNRDLHCRYHLLSLYPYAHISALSWLMAGIFQC